MESEINAFYQEVLGNQKYLSAFDTISSKFLWNLEIANPINFISVDTNSNHIIVITSKDEILVIDLTGKIVYKFTLHLDMFETITNIMVNKNIYVFTSIYNLCTFDTSGVKLGETTLHMNGRILSVIDNVIYLMHSRW